MRCGRILVGLAAVTVVVAGCGSSSKGGNTATTPHAADTASIASTPANESERGSTSQVDPCALLSDADVTAGFALSDVGAPIVEVTKSKNVITPDTASCNFDWKAGNDASSSFALSVHPASVYEGLRSAGAAETVPEVPGAYRTADGYFIGAGNVTLSIAGVVSEAAVAKLFELASGKVG